MKLFEVKFEDLSKELSSSFKQVKDEQSLEQFRISWLGSKGIVKDLFKQLREIPVEQKAKYAKELNQLKNSLEILIKEKEASLNDAQRNKNIEVEYCDLSLPSQTPGLGAFHPIRLVEQKIAELLKPFGFKVVEGPEIETEYYCFDALNIPKHHPARDMQDTFYTDTGELLRTHTTSVQARELEKKELPVKIISAGRVYRNETEDTSHQSMFHQYDLVWIDRGITLSHLMGLLNYILQGLYGRDRRVRFVPKYYPYTNPSIGAQINCSLCQAQGCSACEDSGWVTILGAGLVHKNVLLEFGYDPKEASGMAFGFGTSRLAAQFFNAPNLKTLYDGDLRYLGSLV